MAGRMWIVWIGGVAVVLLALIGVDRFFLWAESRGWIYYRRRKPSRSALGDAFLAVQSIFEADKRHVLEVRRQEHHEEDGEAEPPLRVTDADSMEERGVRSSNSHGSPRQPPTSR